MNSIFLNEHFIIVHNKESLSKIDMRTVLDEIWYIVEYFIVNIFSFPVVFDWGKTKMRILFIHHDLTV